jgi:hypothetical protein
MNTTETIKLEELEKYFCQPLHAAATLNMMSISLVLKAGAILSGILSSIIYWNIRPIELIGRLK